MELASRHRNLVGLLILCALGLGLALILPANKMKANDFSTDNNSVTILTNIVPVLKPLHHDMSMMPVENGEGHGFSVESEIMTMPKDVWVTDLESVVVNAPDWALHHIVLVNVDEPNIACRGLYKMLFGLAENIKTKVSLPAPYGILIKKGTRIKLMGMLHNPKAPIGSGETFKSVSAGFTLSLATAAEPRTKPVDFFLMEVDEAPHCTPDFVFTVPPNSEAYTLSSDFTNEPNHTHLSFPTDWTIVGVSPHIHAWDGGKKLQVFLNQEKIYDFKSTQVSKSPETWSTPTDMTQRHIKAGDMLSLKAEYQNLKSTPLEGAMGIIGVYYHLEKETDSKPI